MAGRPVARVGAARARRRVHLAASARACSTTLLERGYEYLFLSNSDNLGAVLEPRILSWFAREELPFLSEVADRTEADRKGGHLARRARRRRARAARDGADADEDMDAFEDIERHRFFNCEQHLGRTCAR